MMEWNTEKYSQYSKMQFNIGTLGIDKLVPKPNEIILDVGCGFGNLTEKIANLVSSGQVIGIDLDQNMVKACRERITKSKIKNFQVFQKSAIEIDYSNKFDAIFSNFILHWIKDNAKVFDKMYNALKYNGRICIATLYTDPNSPLVVSSEPEVKTKRLVSLVKISEIELGILANFIQKGYYKDILTLEEFMAYQSQVDKNMVYATNTLKQFQDMLTKANFKDIHIEAQRFINEFDEIGTYFDSRESTLWAYFMAYFPKKYRPAIIEKLKKLIISAWNLVPTEKREFPIKEPWPVLFIQARK
jgi:ubiquinone/menaquinone biosynthesis C-methylase UbiE